MYSVVLATMLAAGSSTPAWHHCHGCYSCYGGYSGYSGYRCSGCYCSGGIFPVFHHQRSYCYGGCYGCYGGGYGCSSCYACCGGTVYYGCCGGVAYSSCGGYACCGGTPTVIPMQQQQPPPSEPAPAPKKTPKKAAAPTTSKVIVSLPADAKLWVENVHCPLTSAVRSFDTPPLDPAQRYVYNLKMEVVRDGRSVAQTRRVTIIPGQPAHVNFNAGALTTASR